MSQSSIFKTAKYNYDRTAERLKLCPELYDKLLQPKERIEINLCPTLSDGKMRIVRSFIVKHSDALGPAKGGIRMTPTVSLDDVTGLAMEMTWKSSVIGIPFGGGKAGICYDSFLLNANDKEILVRAFCRGSLYHIGPETYIPAPDIATNEIDMGHIRDCVSRSQGTSITKGCFVTGKPVILGGIVGRREATGKGVVYAILAACERLNLDISKTNVALQGFGNVGSNAAAEVVRRGAKVIVVADHTGAVADDNGIDVDGLLEHVTTTGGVKGYKFAQDVASEAVFESDAQVLIPAATDSQITTANAGRIKASIVAEGANAPTTPEADRVLEEREIFVIPDILCNAGGVFVSYLEYTQETQREQMTVQQVENRLSCRMKQKFNDVYDYAAQEQMSLRDAAMDIAVRRVTEAVYARGFQP